MTKLDRLISEARESAIRRGHTIGRFTHESKTTAYAYCETGCGCAVFCDSKPAPNGIDIHGRAVALTCPNEGKG